MTLGANLTVSLPIGQRTVDLGMLKDTIASKITGRVHAGRTKISEQPSADRLTAKADGSRYMVNLGGMQRAAQAAGKVPANAPPPQPMPGASQARGGRVRQDGPVQIGQGGGASAPTERGADEARGDGPAPRAAERAQALASDLRDLRGDLDALRAAHRTAHDAAGVLVAGREVDLLTRRNAVQERVAALLDQADAARAAARKEARPDLEAKLESARRQILTAALAAEFPQTVEAAQARFETTKPDNGASILRGREFRAVEAEARAFLVTWAPPGDPDAGPPEHPDMPARLDGLIDRLARRQAAGTLTARSEAVLDYLRELRTAVGLRVTLDSAVLGLERMHDRLKGNPASDDPASGKPASGKPALGDPALGKASIGRLCREFTHYGNVFKDSRSSKPADQLNALGVVDSLTYLLGRNAPPATFVTQGPGVRALLTALRVADFRDQAAMTFAAGRADPQALADLGATARKADRIPTAGEIAALIPADQAEAFGAALTAADLAVRTHEAYDDAYRSLERILGADKAAAYRGAVWLQVGIPQNEAPKVVTGPEGNTAFGTTPEGTRRAVARAADLVHSAPTAPDDNRLHVMRAEAKLVELGRKNPEAAFMVANLAVLEHQVAVLEQGIVGRAAYDTLTVAQFDPARVMKLAGVTTEQMVKLGYAPEDAASFPARLQTLSRGGFRSVDHLDSHIRYLHHVSRETMTNRSIQSMAAGAAGASAAAIGSRLRTEIFSDAAALGLEEAPGTRAAVVADATLKADDVAVRDGFRKVADAVREAVRRDDTLATAESAAVFRELDDALVGLLHERSALRGRLDEARRDLHAASARGVAGGLDLDPMKPAGLRSARAILAAIDLDTEVMRLEAIQAPAGLIIGMRGQRDAALDRLRGLDGESVRRPWHAKFANLFTAAERPEIGTLRALRAVAENIVFVREGIAAAQARTDAAIGRTVAERHAVAAGRMAGDPKVMGSVQQMIRAAVLANWPASNVTAVVRDGRVVDAFEPALHRAAIEATLGQWGLDVEAFAPEIGMVLNGTLARHDLANWRRETRPLDPATNLIAGPDTRTRARRFADHLAQELKATFSKDGARNAALYLLNKRQRDERFQATFLALADSLREGDKFDFKSGYRLALNSGKIPVEPTGTVSVRARMAATGLSNLVIERSGDGWKVTARAGGQAQIGADVFAEQKIADPIAIGVSGSLDLAGGYLGGYTETFRDDAGGRRAFTALLTCLVNGERPDGEVFESVIDAATNREVAGKASAKLKSYARFEVAAQPFGTDGDMFASGDATTKSGAGNKVGIGASISGEISASLGGKYKVVRSANKAVYETEREVAVGVNLNLNAYAKLPTGLGALSNAILQDAQRGADADTRLDTLKNGTPANAYDTASGTANESLVDGNLGAAETRTQKMKQEYTVAASGVERMVKAELTRRGNAVIGAENALFGLCNADFRQRLDREPGLRRDFDALKRSVDNEDALQITYELKSDHVRRVNDMLSIAEDLAGNGRGLAAFALRRKVGDILDDDDAYEVRKVTVLTKTSQKELANRGNAILVSFDIVAETGMERAQVVWKVPAKPLA